jgi:carbon-monoxide dehydrogenase medium subunit
VQIPAAFDYERAESVEHALALLDQRGPESRILAGGHSLLPMMKLRLARPEWLIDINDLHELAFIERDGDTLRVGAMVRHAALLDSALIARELPIIRDAERVIADPVVRNRGTIGGSLCQADPAEDLSTVCAVLRAQAVIRGPAATRVIDMADFYRGPYETAVAQTEILTELRFPLLAAPGRSNRASSAYVKVDRRVGDWAVVAAGAAVVLAADGSITDVSIGVTAVGAPGTITRAEQAIRGAQPGEAAFDEAARIAGEDCDPIADQRGPVDYKRHLAAELTRRVLRTACARAAEQG